MNGRFLLALGLASSPVLGQTAQQVPFGSENNAIELTVVNTARVSVENVLVKVLQAPPWLHLATGKQSIRHIDASEEQTASFSFSVDQSAPVEKAEILKFGIRLLSGQEWIREMSISVAPPEKPRLFQNYPNPFNPATTISYLLPSPAYVTLKVYNVLGQEVTTLFEGDEDPGYHQHPWAGDPVASGVYLYQLTLRDDAGNISVDRKMMQVMK